METSIPFSQEILLPKIQICEFDALPLPSTIVDKIVIHSDNITVTNSTLQDLGGNISEVVVNVEWNRPGNTSIYDVRVTEQESLDDDSDFGEEFTLQRIEVCALLPGYSNNKKSHLHLKLSHIHVYVHHTYYSRKHNFASKVCLLCCADVSF